MRADVLRSYPEVDPAKVHVVHNGIDSRGWARGRGPGRRPRASASTPTGPRSSSSGGSPGRRGCPTSCAPPGAAARRAARALRGRAGHPGDHGRGRGAGRRAAQTRGGVVWIDRMLPRDEVVALLQRRHRLRLPVGLRAARHRQPRGDGLRAGRRRARRPAASPRSSRTARPGWLVPIEQVDDGTGTPVDPDAVRRRPGRRAERGASRPRPGPRRSGRAGRARRGRALLLGLDRRPDPRGLPRRRSAELVPVSATSGVLGARRAHPGEAERAHRGGGRDGPVGGGQQRGEQHPAALVGGAGQRGRGDRAARARCPG